MPAVKTCCCGCSLRQGVVAAGIVSVFEASVCIFMGGTYLNNADRIEAGDVVRSRSSYFHLDEESIHVQTDQNDHYKNWGIYILVNGLIIMTISFFLLLGATSSRHAFLLPWLIVRAIWITLNVITAIICLFDSTAVEEVAYCGGLVYVSFMIYLYIVVVSYFQQQQHSALYQTDDDSMVPVTVGTSLGPRWLLFFKTPSYRNPPPLTDENETSMTSLVPYSTLVESQYPPPPPPPTCPPYSSSQEEETAGRHTLSSNLPPYPPPLQTQPSYPFPPPPYSEKI